MFAMQLTEMGPLSDRPVVPSEIPVPIPGPGQLVLRVVACGVCRSNLHMVHGDWAANGVPARLPITPGHEVAGIVHAIGLGVTDFMPGDRVGVQPLWWTCEECRFCRSGQEELCASRVITGEHVDGGYAEFMLATAAHSYRIPDGLDLVEAAPMFCPGITAYSAVEKLGLGAGDRVAVYGVGGVGHMAIQFALLTGAEVIAVTSSPRHREVMAALGDVEVVDPEMIPAGRLQVDGALLFAPSNEVAARALADLRPGGTLVCGVIADFPAFSFATGKSIVASILGSRRQMREVLSLAERGEVHTVVESFPLSQAPEVLELLEQGRVPARAVLVNEVTA